MKLSFGQNAVGLTFNPSGDDNVSACKQEFATAIDRMHELREKHRGTTEAGNEIARMASVAITELQTAQMWAVKALTWR